ncbi:TniB family NTP-binding protein [Pseudoalteromonas luteoviolacea]|uniref:TniB family NTP-binding protein n=1 Tax=Pseudoalteromonas luteoviolacea TaxID=43657 RepID=UPI001F370062|nr:TniB family NTP-binding protein [Pseudoalteromonas luteoviolacea]MCF6441045.1 TniB family NTP-binding protein [Pseudoalteromonas luteoviolacea]
MEHLHKEIRQLLDLDQQARIKETLKRRWIGYSQANQILNRMEELVNHPKVHRMPNLLIKADTNNGKSYLIQKFLKNHRPYVSDTSTVVVPVVSIEIQPDANANTLYGLILDELEVTYSFTAKKEVKTKLVFDALERMQVKLLIIDELHVLMNTTKLKKAQMLDTLKYLGNRAQIPIVGAGTKEAHTAVVSDPQLANRFEPMELPHWKLNTDYRKLLATFEQLLPLANPSNLQQQEIAIQIFAMTGGIIGEIDSLLKRATISAIKNKSECITLNTLKELNWQSPEERRRI